MLLLGQLTANFYRWIFHREKLDATRHYDVTRLRDAECYRQTNTAVKKQTQRKYSLTLNCEVAATCHTTGNAEQTGTGKSLPTRLQTKLSSRNYLMYYSASVLPKTSG